MRHYLLIIFIVVFSISSNAQFYTIRRNSPVTIISQEKNVTFPDSIKLQKQQGRKMDFWCSMPLERTIFITSPYGYRIDPFTGKKRFHNGIDLKCSNDKVLSMLPGKIKKIGYKKKGLGNYVIIVHKPFEITYGHLEYVLVTKGDIVMPGTIVAVSGKTGRSTGPHLHLEIKYRGKRCDPLPLLSFIDKTIKLQKQIKDSIMNKKVNPYLTALDHVQDAYSDEFALFLDKENKTLSEESALLFLEKKEKELLSSEQVSK